MTDEALWLDGNALAGIFEEVLGVDMTDVPRRCRSCGRVSAVGAHRLYRGAGLVLRCPGCGDLAMRVVHVAGAWRIDVPG